MIIHPTRSQTAITPDAMSSAGPHIVTSLIFEGCFCLTLEVKARSVGSLCGLFWVYSLRLFAYVEHYIG